MKKYLLLPFLFLTACSGWDDDKDYVPMPAEAFLFTGTELHTFRDESYLAHQEAPYKALAILDGDRQTPESSILLLATEQGVVELNTDDLSYKLISDRIKPRALACGNDYHLIATADELIFWQKDQPFEEKYLHRLSSVDPFKDYGQANRILYSAGKFYLTFANNQTAIFSEKALTELYRTKVAHPVSDMQLDRFRRVWLIGSDSAGIRYTRLDPNGNVALPENQAIKGVRELRLSPYNSRPYERERIEDVYLLPNGTIQGINDLTNVLDVAVNFDASVFYAVGDSACVVYDANRKKVLRSVKGLTSPIRKSIFMLKRNKKVV